jgi:hypothetical protein
MKKLLVSAALLASMSLSAFAADIPLKAIPYNPLTGYPAGSGLYFGVNGALATGKANQVSATTVAANSGALVTQQGEVGLTLGWTWALPGSPFWAAVEGTFDFSNINSQQAPLTGLSIGGPADFEQMVIIGAPWDQIAQLIPNLGSWTFPTLPKLPNGVSAGPGNLYMFVGAYEQDVSQNFSLAPFKEFLLGLNTGVGNRWRMTNNTALDIRFEYRTPTNSRCVGVVLPSAALGCTGMGPSYMVRTAVLW